jgi:hypothetical protein
MDERGDHHVKQSKAGSEAQKSHDIFSYGEAKPKRFIF